MRQAVKEGKARGSSLALLEDRVNLRTGKNKFMVVKLVQMQKVIILSEH